MIKYVNTPNLPQNNVKKALCGRVQADTQCALKKLGIELITLQRSDLLGKNVSDHADLQCIHTGGDDVFLSSEQKEAKEILENMGYNVTLFDGLTDRYPFDCLVNAAIVGNNVICKRDIIHFELLKAAEKKKLRIIGTNQGYTKCSVCVVDEKSIITEDEGIKNACENYGIDVLLIRKGFVLLEGFDYGFIGGATFKLNKNTLVFNGVLQNHPDFERIKGFLNKKSIDYKCIGNYCLTDIGGVIPISEY